MEEDIKQSEEIKVGRSGRIKRITNIIHLFGKFIERIDYDIIIFDEFLCKIGNLKFSEFASWSEQDGKFIVEKELKPRFNIGDEITIIIKKGE